MTNKYRNQKVMTPHGTFDSKREYRRYQELLLTNRQYAFARHAQGSICVTAANSDDQESRLSIPVPLHASQAENLMDGSIIPVENGTLNLTLPGNSSVVLKIRED